MEEFGKNQPDFKVHQTIHQMQLNCSLVIYFSNKFLDETKELSCEIIYLCAHVPSNYCATAAKSEISIITL